MEVHKESTWIHEEGVFPSNLNKMIIIFLIKKN